ncbi:MAG: hypothetical protein AB1805_05785 [Nitrospirota bacterium]
MDVKEIKELAKKYTPDQIERCITQQLETGANVCIDSRPAEEIISSLSKAELVSELVAEGMPLADAIRELAKRIRRAQQGFDPGETWPE